jgi:TolB protein
LIRRNYTSANGLVTNVTRTWPVLAVLVAALGLVPAAQAAFPGRNGRVAYVATASAAPEFGGPSRFDIALVTVTRLGRNPLQLRTCTRIEGMPDTPDCATDFGSPAWSPDGRRIAVDAGPRLAVMASDGSGFRLLPQQTGDDGAPAWSPDGRRIAFAGAAAGSTATDVYVLNLRRGSSRRLTTTGGRSPAWSSRNRIAFVTARGQLAAVDPDGSHRRRLTRKGGLAPAFAPRGGRIAFVRKGKLYVMNANGGGLRRVRGRQPIAAEDVAWSPDGRLLVFHPFESGLFVVGVNGRGERELAGSGYSSDGSYDSFAPDWQPLPRR